MSLPTVSESADIALRPIGEEVVRLEDVGVRYRVPTERFFSFKEFAIRWIQRKVAYKEFWALRHINLSIARGEVLGIIGRNGAGKSTLLKLVARVMKPTEGRVVVKGIVAPMLEFGAGFHPELTGRENVYLNGALLGFSHKEMDEKFQRIVDFAELWNFIDAPMRTYSSGMWARLGFAVATDVEPDVLIVDEVLSVGDASFQQKSLDRMRSFHERGVAILLVSHNLRVVQDMCHRVAWIEHGQLKMVGETAEVISSYQESFNK